MTAVLRAATPPSSDSQRRRALDLRPYDYLDWRIRGDGNTYLASMRLDQLTGGDEEVYQTFLHTK